MTADGKRRPVSGEIMTAAAHGAGRTAREIPSAGTSAHPGRFFFAATRRRPQGLRMLERASGGHATKAGAVFWVSGLVLALCAFWVSGGHALVRPEANKDAAGLKITHVETRIEAKAGHATLIVDGEARNRDHKARIMPPVAIAVTASTGTVLRYRMSAGSDLVAPDDVYLFSSRLRAPPEGVKSVAVTLEPAD